MKKPVSMFALTLWICACVLALLYAFETWSIYENLRIVSQQASETRYVVQSIVRTISEFIFQIAMLVGIGALIEVVDRVRWDSKNRS